MSTVSGLRARNLNENVVNTVTNFLTDFNCGTHLSQTNRISWVETFPPWAQTGFFNTPPPQGWISSLGLHKLQHPHSPVKFSHVQVNASQKLFVETLCCHCWHSFVDLTPFSKSSHLLLCYLLCTVSNSVLLFERPLILSACKCTKTRTVAGDKASYPFLVYTVTFLLWHSKSSLWAISWKPPA